MPDNEARKLLEFIINTRIASLEEKQAEFTARALDDDDRNAVMTSHNVETESEAADRLFPAFVTGLRYAGAQRASGQAVVLDDADPQQNAGADALVRFLVRPNLASVETEELGEGHYRYHVTVDWPGLEQTATLAGVDLNAALAG
ncbi:MAG: hypothetical protein ACR2M0_06095 [Chloroflexia bacterium]